MSWSCLRCGVRNGMMDLENKCEIQTGHASLCRSLRVSFESVLRGTTRSALIPKIEYCILRMYTVSSEHLRLLKACHVMSNRLHNHSCILRISTAAHDYSQYAQVGIGAFLQPPTSCLWGTHVDFANHHCRCSAVGRKYHVPRRVPRFDDVVKKTREL